MAILLNTEEKLKKTNQRADCYRLLASFFYPPQRDYFLNESVCQNLKDLLDVFCPEANVHVDIIQKQLESNSEEELTIEFASLFIGPFELKAPPYGSVYLENSRRVMGKTTMETLAMYQDCGLSVDVKEPPDHIAIELEFMNYLIAKEAESLQSGDVTNSGLWMNRQAQFLCPNLAKWVPDFCKSIKDGTKSEYFQALAVCLSLFIESESERMK